MKPREFDWQRFWLQEIVILSAPTLIAVMTSRHDPPLEQHRLVILFIIFIGATIWNLILNRPEKRRTKSIPKVKSQA